MILKKPVRTRVGYQYRSADGSGNSLIYPDMGKSGSVYARTVPSKHIQSKPLPSPSDIFDLLLCRKKFIPNETNINVLGFYMATLVSHELFYSDSANPLINTTSSYFDLSTVYGRNEKEQKLIRTFDKGMIKPDCFSDMRLTMQPAGLIALLVIFSRNHNFIVKKLLEKNENKRFNYEGISLKQQDEDLFQTARVINSCCAINIILKDYLNTFLGIPDGSKFSIDATSYPKK